jgi:hypothetical protein
LQRGQPLTFKRTMKNKAKINKAKVTVTGDKPTKIDGNGNKYWHNKAGELHRDNDLPAIVYTNGSQQWYQNDYLHRDNDKPAIITRFGDNYWYQHDKLHRDNDKPAVVEANGSQEWYQNGKIHRDNDKPAVIQANGTQRWYQNGELHRDNDKPATILANGEQYWYQHGLRHRDNDLPAAVYFDGAKEWYKDGRPYKFYRGDDKPAVVAPDSVSDIQTKHLKPQSFKYPFLNWNRIIAVEKGNWDNSKQDNYAVLVFDSGTNLVTDMWLKEVVGFLN